MRLIRPFRRLLDDCERRLSEVVAGHAVCLSTPAADTLAAGGKRLRPLLVFCAAPDPAARRDALVSAASAVELVHMATLVHDDIIDGASLRRGRPTIADAQGPAVAAQVGDFLFARAFAELTETGDPEAVRELAEAALALSQGELLQQQAAFDIHLTEDAYLARCRCKTASLFAVACRLGARVGGGDPITVDRVGAFGEHVGMAFQIFDDILDLTGDPEATGKRRGTDLRDGTVTLPVIYAMRDDPSLAARVAGVPHGEDVDALCRSVAGTPAMAEARERALSFVRSAREALEGLQGVAVAALSTIADGVVDRYS